MLLSTTSFDGFRGAIYESSAEKPGRKNILKTVGMDGIIE